MAIQILKNLLINSLQETHFKDIHGQKVKRWKKIFHVNGNQKKARVAILVSGKIHFQLKIITLYSFIHLFIHLIFLLLCLPCVRLSVPKAYIFRIDHSMGLGAM